jgi:hypothetical protein
MGYRKEDAIKYMNRRSSRRCQIRSGTDREDNIPLATANVAPLHAGIARK